MRHITGISASGIAMVVLGGLAFALVTAGQATAAEHLEVSFFDVGQADATLLHHPDGTILIDTGDAERGDVVDHVRDVGVDTIDLLVVTHPHPEHIGQFDQVIEHLDVGTVWWSGSEGDTQAFRDAEAALEASDAAYVEPRRGDTRDVGPLAVEVINPPAGVDTSDVHDTNLVLRVTFGDSRWLFTGDAEAPTEERMVAETVGLLYADVYQAGHHGDDSSTTAEFLHAVDPSVAVWSASADNPYGHPSPTVLDRIEDHGVATFGTRDHGTVTATTDGSTITVTPESGEGYTFTASGLAFPDIDGNVHEGTIGAIVEADIASGYTDGTYGPADAVTRGQMATFLHRGFDLPEWTASEDDLPFSDVAGTTHETGILAIAQAGITAGSGDGTFRPGEDVTRGQMAAFLARALDLADAPADFDDTDGHTHEGAIGAVTAAGIANGLGDGSFGPDQAVTRGQMATFLVHALELR